MAVALAVGCFYPVAQCLVWGQLSLFLTFFFVLFLHFERRGERFAAGLAVVPLTAKPHLFFLLAIPGLLWLAQLPARERRAFLAGPSAASRSSSPSPRCAGRTRWLVEGVAVGRAEGPAPRRWNVEDVHRPTLVRSALAARSGVAPRGRCGRCRWRASRRGGVPSPGAARHRVGRRGAAADVPVAHARQLRVDLDQSLLLPVQVALVCDAVGLRDPAPRRACSACSSRSSSSRSSSGSDRRPRIGLHLAAVAMLGAWV